MVLSLSEDVQFLSNYRTVQGRRQVKKCGVDTHGERVVHEPIKGLRRSPHDRLPFSPLPSKSSPDLHQSQERPLAKVGEPESTPWRRP